MGDHARFEARRCACTLGDDGPGGKGRRARADCPVCLGTGRPFKELHRAFEAGWYECLEGERRIEEMHAAKGTWRPRPAGGAGRERHGNFTTEARTPPRGRPGRRAT